MHGYPRASMLIRPTPLASTRQKQLHHRDAERKPERGLALVGIKVIPNEVFVAVGPPTADGFLRASVSLW
jgi:hypothetical protein